MPNHTKATYAPSITPFWAQGPWLPHYKVDGQLLPHSLGRLPGLRRGRPPSQRGQASGG
jgi:hypothetical protein